MSDALTDLARDARRSRYHYRYLELLTNYLEKKPDDQELLEKIFEAAENTDSVVGGYWSGRTNLSAEIKEGIRLLREGDKNEWARLLSVAVAYPWIYQRLKAVSPFPEALLVCVNYGQNFVVIKGELEDFFHRLIRGRKGWRTYDGDRYVVFLPMPEAEKAEIFWLDCGRVGIKGPRKEAEEVIE